jgi:peptidyl-prolyl cis-trans isomerase A (cyclophilin A)
LAALSLVQCHRSTADEAKASPPAVEEIFGTTDASTLGPVAVEIETTAGTFHCTVEPSHAPRAAAMFVGLATGRAPFVDPATSRVVRLHYYDGLSVFRAIDGAMIQSGCPLGNGTGTPGYRIAVEARDDDRARLARPGALALARYNPPPNRPDPRPPPAGEVIGSQFIVTVNDMSHLAGQVTVLGQCTELDVVAKIARVVGRREQPVTVLRVVSQQ